MRRSRFSAATALVAAFLLFAAPAVAADDPLIIEGSGFGHGVGMSQYGAYGRALDGQTYDQILGAYYQGTTVGTIGSGGIPALDDVMVSVASDDPDVTITIEDGPGSGGTPTTLTRIGGAAETVDLFPGNTVTIIDESPTANGGCVVTVTTAAGDAEWETGPCDFTVGLADSSAPPDNLVTLDDCRTTNCTFAWGEVLHIIDNGSSRRITPDKTCSGGLCPGFDLVVQASLDDYTLGIAEVPFSWGDSATGKHALYTQAVAARSYAASFTTSRNHAVWGCFCDLINSSSAQVYAGWIGDRAKWQNWDAAARFTAGEVVAHPNGYDGIVRAYYSSANGGASENNEDMWGGSPISWLRSVDDPWTTSASSGNPNRSWTKSTTTGILESRLDLDAVNEVRIAETFDSGTPSRIVVVGQRNGQTVEVDTYAGSPLDGKVFDTWFGLLSPHIDGFSGDLPDPPPLTDTARWAGEDRYETAVEISQATYPSGADAVIIATGLNHPDALAAASLAATIDAPVLLVAGGTVPASTFAEVDRLDPSEIFILGGTAAVPQSAEDVLDDIAPVTRLAGANRYTTAIEISQATHAGPVDTVYVAPGTSFVEALVAGPVAASRNAAILLVPPTSVPGSVANELQRLDPGSIVVVGGGGPISSSVVSQLGAYADSVTSIAGANRYDTSVRVAQHGFPSGADTVLVATGAIFPDALAGAGVGGDLASPILLVEPSNLPGVVANELGRLDPLTVRVLGGPAAISDGVVAEMVDLLD